MIKSLSNGTTIGMTELLQHYLPFQGHRQGYHGDDTTQQG